MIRRDYILRMIEEFVQALARINSLKRSFRWDQAGDALDAEFNKLVGAGAPALARLSETELLARVIQGEPTLAVREKTLILTTLLNEAGDVAAAQDRPEESRECRLKALHLLLDVLGRGEIFECPEFVPAVDVVVTSLQDAPLLARTRALLMQHYERAGERLCRSYTGPGPRASPPRLCPRVFHTPTGEWPLLSNKASKAGISAAVIALGRISELGAWSVQTRILGAFALDGARFSSAGSVGNQIRGQGSQ